MDMETTIDMVHIVKCSATSCAYNHEQQCCTPAITVGSEHPACETFMNNQNKGGVRNLQGSVGACHVGQCKFNHALECHAPGIQVGIHEGHADCQTYNPK